ncbi:related to protein ASI1 [Zygosaccharomyces bailii]|nr:related to protein ASI1 [Zygosaccharomyces bailii]
MNSSDTGASSIVDSFAYLNQTARYLVPNSVIFSSLINFPYRLGLSFVDAVRIQYQQAVEADSLMLSLTCMKEIVNYFLSSYAIASFITALILNRFVIMASLRSTANRVTLPLWSRVCLHLSAIMPLLYTVAQVLCQYGILQWFAPLDLAPFLSRTFAAYAWSNCVETFVATTTNTLPLEESDYSIFELSVQFYFLNRMKETSGPSSDYLPDCMMAALGRILIHVVEMFSCRKYRLIGSTVLNCGGIIHLGYKVKREGFESLPALTRYRNFPKIFSLFLIIMSVSTYSLAYLVRKDPFGSGGLDHQELQFYSFMHSWWTHLNCTGEEEFSYVVVKLALMLCMGHESMSKGVFREFPHVNVPSSIHHSYVISGYLNGLPTIPEDMDDKSHGGSVTTNAPGIVNRFRISLTMIKAFFAFFRKSKLHHPRLEPSNKPKDCNRYVTERNYAKFLFKPKTNDDDKDSENNQYLLPDEDPSADYLPDPSDELETDTEWVSDDEDIGTILAPDNVKNLQEDISWHISMWSILKSTVQRGTRMTRKQYASLEPQKILTEVVLEKASAQENNMSDEDDIDPSFACVVCKTNPRNVVLWPCKCFALCESCRVSLGLRGFNSCVCCRREVHGYSKLHTV